MTSFLVAETLTGPVTLDDGTVIPAGSTMTVGEDGTVQYTDASGNILAQVSTTTLSSGGTRVTIVRPNNEGSFEQVVVTKSPAGTVLSVSSPTSLPTPPAPVTPGGTGGGGGAGGPGTGSPGVPNNPANVV